MTPIEQAELNELRMTPEQLEQRRLEVETKLHAEPNGIAPTRRRRVRSDKGVSKGPKLVPEPAPSAAAISAVHATELKRLAEAMCSSAQSLAEAQRRNVMAAAEYYAYVDALTK